MYVAYRASITFYPFSEFNICDSFSFYIWNFEYFHKLCKIIYNHKNIHISIRCIWKRSNICCYSSPSPLLWTILEHLVFIVVHSVFLHSQNKISNSHIREYLANITNSDSRYEYTSEYTYEIQDVLLIVNQEYTISHHHALILVYKSIISRCSISSI